MSEPLATYSSQLVQVIFNGFPILGYADGDFCKITRDEEAFFKKTGADGSTSRARNANQAGAIELTLQSTSPSNDVLSTQAELDELFNGGFGTAVVKDASGNTLWSAQNAWVKKRAETTFSKEQNTRVWVLDCDRLTGHVGGNVPGI
jgi:hypothetical protein